MFFWGMFHVFSAAIFPFIIGRVLCSWICPNATMQDALYKNMDFKRPIPDLPKAIEEQSHSYAMRTSAMNDQTASFLPATLLFIWFIYFNIETVFDLSSEPWWPAIAFMGGMMTISLLFKWREACTHF